jgi:hypothetical protein
MCTQIFGAVGHPENLRQVGKIPQAAGFNTTIALVSLSNAAPRLASLISNVQLMTGAALTKPVNFSSIFVDTHLR